jgi:hypothetical protein
MYILIKPKPISPKTRVYLVKSFRDINGVSKYRIIKKYGSYLTLVSKNPQAINELKLNAQKLSDNDDGKITIYLQKENE